MLEPQNGELGWPLAISCSEGMRWANNTGAAMLKNLIQMLEGAELEGLTLPLKGVFRRMPKKALIGLLLETGIDPSTL